MRNEPYKTVETEKEILKIYQNCSEIDNPRDWDNLGTMACSHKRYSLGDTIEKHEVNFDKYNGWGEAYEAIQRDNDTAIILPLYLYDHSGITMRTTSFNDGWDSGQVGFIFISKEKVREEYSVKRISPKLLERVKGYLLNEVETYDQYLTGEVYSFELTDIDGNHIDSCGGFYGDDFNTNGIADHVGKELIELL